MKKSYSKKERLTRKLIKNTIAVSIIIILITIVIIVLTDSSDVERRYAAEEMLHDHDGDGIPDH